MIPPGASPFFPVPVLAHILASRLVSSVRLSTDHFENDNLTEAQETSSLLGHRNWVVSLFEIHDITSGAMYAEASHSKVFHLFNPKNGLTVCGLKVGPITAKSRSREARLRRTPTRPLDKVLCKHCVRLSKPNT